MNAMKMTLSWTLPWPITLRHHQTPGHWFKNLFLILLLAFPLLAAAQAIPNNGIQNRVDLNNASNSSIQA